MKMALTSIDLISKRKKKEKFARAGHFLNTPFCLSSLLFCTTTMPFCTTKTSNFLVTHYFYGGIVICTYQRFCFLRSFSLLFFQCRLFSPSR